MFGIKHQPELGRRHDRIRNIAGCGRRGKTKVRRGGQSGGQAFGQYRQIVHLRPQG